MSGIFEKIEYRGYTIVVFYDEDPADPINEFDNEPVKIAAWHRRYNLGNVHFDEPDDFVAFWKKENPIVLPLYMLDHSGIALSTSSFHDPWDSGQLGFVYISRKDALEMYGWKRLTQKRIFQVKKMLRSRVEAYSHYVNGSVYGYIINDPDDNEIDDSCWGFYGWDHKESGLLESAQEAIDNEIEMRAQHDEVHAG